MIFFISYCRSHTFVFVPMSAVSPHITCFAYIKIYVAFFSRHLMFSSRIGDCVLLLVANLGSVKKLTFFFLFPLLHGHQTIHTATLYNKDGIIN